MKQHRYAFKGRAGRILTADSSTVQVALVLTHFSSRYQFRPDTAPLSHEIANEAAEFYGGNLFLAQGFADYRLSRDLTLA